MCYVLILICPCHLLILTSYDSLSAVKLQNIYFVLLWCSGSLHTARNEPQQIEFLSEFFDFNAMLRCLDVASLVAVTLTGIISLFDTTASKNLTDPLPTNVLTMWPDHKWSGYVAKPVPKMKIAPE